MSAVPASQALLGQWLHGALISVGLILVLASASPVRAQLECVQRAGVLDSVQGIVETADATASEAVWHRAALNDAVCGGMLIRTDKDSRAEITLINQSKVRIDQSSTIRLVEVFEQSPSMLRLLRGAAYFFSRQPRILEIDTPFVTAGVEGTEFIIRVASDSAHLSVFEGKVRWQNELGSMLVASGESAAAEPGSPPRPFLLVKPPETVHWALYYDPILEPLLTGPLDRVPETLRAPVAALRAGDIAGAIEQFSRTPEEQRDEEFHLYRAATMLQVGRVDAARSDIDLALQLNPQSALARALLTVILVAQNAGSQALAEARQAVALDPNSAPSFIALSYAEQSALRIEAARGALRRAVSIEPDNALAWARMSEVQLMLDDWRAARRSARKAADLAPDLSRTQTVLGFIELVLRRQDRAKAAFERAIKIDSADPQPRLGLGLARIRNGDLDAGRVEIEIAVALSPARALLRSYLGKAYFEEKRDRLAGDQFEMAKQLDPLDPTPWLYDAIRKQTENRPVEAVHDLQTSIALNDNRAVYRSRELLDQDRAARGASLARIYSDLGFTQLGVNEASSALSLDPANSMAHRFLSDINANQPRREIVRASELLQSQLLQSVNINPVQPTLLNDDFNIISSTGPARPGFNEYTSLFERNRIQYDVSGVVGNQWTRGVEGIVSGVYDWLSLSAGQTLAQTDGFRQNFDQQNSLTDIFAQAAITPDLSIQAEFRRRVTEAGDRQLSFDVQDFSHGQRNDIDQDSGRLGLRYSPSASSDVLASVILTRRNAKVQEPDVGDIFVQSSDFRTQQSAVQGEAQHIFRSEDLNVVSGVGVYNVRQRDRDRFGFVTDLGEPLYLTDNQTFDVEQISAYSRLVYHDGPLVWTLGLNFDDFHEQSTNYRSIDPKLGISWLITRDIRLRAAAFRTVKPPLVVSQTLQPTEVAGFNQFFDDINGTRATTFGFGLDASPLTDLWLGTEFYRRNLDVPVSSLGQWIGGHEDLLRGYTYWTIGTDWALSGEVRYDRFTANAAPFPQRVDTLSLPVSLFYFSPSGWFAGAGPTFVDQTVRQRDSSGAVEPNQCSDFVLLDTQIGYRLPRRSGIATLHVNNILNKHFNYLDDGFRESGSQNPRVSPYLPERTIFATLTLQF